MRRALLVTSLVALLIGTASPVLATGPVLPPTIPNTPTNEFYYDLWFGAPPQGSTPSGRIVADSGFRPSANGLPYANYGSSLAEDALFFGTPDNALQPMSSQDMRSLYGDGVCITLRNTVSGGPCDLTPAAKYYSMYLLESVAAVGHCVGFAVAAAALYNGQLSPAALGAQTLGNQSDLNLDTQSQLLRQWSTQFTTPVSRQTPADVVRTLVRTMRPGKVSYAMVIRWVTPQGGAEGHGITPFAVLNKGGGLYDIAVYDNNYPGQTRAIHVDMNANTWEYVVSVNPSSGPTVATGDANTLTMGLMDVRTALAKQPCSVCGPRTPTDLAVFGAFPVSQNGKIEYGFRDLLGKAVPSSRLNLLPQLTAPRSTQFMLPAAQIVRHSGYRMWIKTAENGRAVPVDAQIAAGSGLHQIDWGTVAPGARATITVSDGGDMLAVASNQQTRPTITQVFQQRKRHYTVVTGGGTVTATGVARYLRLDRAEGAVSMGRSENRKGSQSVSVSLQTPTGTVSFRAENVAWALGQHLILDYGHWRSVYGAPTLWVRDVSTGVDVRQVPLSRVG